MPNIVRHKRYIKSYTEANNNKFWYITEYDDGSIKVEWGRVGHAAQTKVHAPGKKNFDTLCRSKERARHGEPPYRPLDVVDAPGDGDSQVSTSVVSHADLETVAVREIAGGNSKIETLIRHITKQNIHNILTKTTMTYNSTTGLFSTSCGIVTQANIDMARVKLSSMRPYILAKDWCPDYIQVMEDYLMLVPQVVANMRHTEKIFPDDNSVQEQNNILDSLQASLDSLKATSPEDESKDVEQSHTFGVRLVEVSDVSTVSRVKDMFRATIHRGHECSHLRLANLFEVHIKSMRERFEKEGMPIGNIKQLWHGTRVANVLSILHKGLIIPPSSASHCTGRMFGNGLYFSDQSTKSLNYSYGYWDGRARDNHAMMFLADVAMGKEYIPSRGWGSGYPKPGYDSTYAIGGRSGVSNNEMIVYSLGQCNLVYLCQFASTDKTSRW